MHEHSLFAKTFPGAASVIQGLRREDAIFDEVCRDFLELSDADGEMQLAEIVLHDPLRERTVLVENGVMSSFIHDSISARHYGVTPTGSGRRESFRHVPMPRMRCTYMENGPHDREAIIRSVDKGIYCESFQNGQVAIGAGDFAFYVRQGYLIENGKVTTPVKGAMLIGDGPEALQRISMVGNDLALDTGVGTCGKEGQGVPVSQGMPTVRVAKLSVGGVNA